MTRYSLILLAGLLPLTLHAQQDPIPDAPAATHVDPLGGAHGGADPHAALNADQQIKVALQHRLEGRLPEAIKVMELSLRSNPSHAASYAVLADLLSEQGEQARALAMIEQAIALDSANALFHVSRALMYMPFERFDEALVDLDRAVDLDSDLIAARFNRGSLLVQLEQYESALADFNHCIAVDPHLPAPYFNRGAVYYLLGSREKAVSDIEHFIELTSNEDWKTSARELLQVWQEQESARDDAPAIEAK